MKMNKGADPRNSRLAPWIPIVSYIDSNGYDAMALRVALQNVEEGV